MTYSYFDASFAFTAAITLLIARTLNSGSYPSAASVEITPFPFPFTLDDQLALDTSLSVLSEQAAAGNVPAAEFARLVRLLEGALQALQAGLWRDSGDLSGL